MDSLSLSGIFKGAINPTIYKSIGNDLYNSSSKISSLYDTNITTPLNNQMIYYLTPTFRNKSLALTTGKTANIFWSDMVGASLPASNLNSQTITYTNVNNTFLQFQRAHAGAFVSSVALDTTKMLTNNIYSLLNTAVPAERAYVSATITRSNSVVSTTVANSYLFSNTTGVLLRNDCYNRTFEINGFLATSSNTVTNGASFTVYIYLGTDIIAQTDICCNTSKVENYVNIYAVIKTTVADVDKYIDFKIRYSGSVLVSSATQMTFSVKSL